MEHARRVILFAAQDAGPAAYLAEVAKGLGSRAVCLASKTASPAFERRGLRSSALDGADLESAAGVVVGTSLGATAEKSLLARAKAAGKPSVSVIEHWSNFRERFESNGALQLPDFILVNDDLARAGAEKAGLPAAKLRALGNPVLEALAQAVPARPRREDFLRDLGVEGEGRVVVFVSEVCADVPQGFDEKQVLEDVVASLAPSDRLVIKLHPAEKADKYPGRRVVAGALDPVSLALHADKIVGMGSMLLLEAAVRRGDVVSHRPGETRPFIGNQVGATRPTRDRHELKAALSSPRAEASAWGRGFSGSNARIAKFLDEALS